MKSSPRQFDTLVSPHGGKDCYCCVFAKFEYYMSDIDWDVTGCKKWGLYDDDARFEKKCGEEGRDYIGKTKLDWLLYDIKRWIWIAWDNIHYDRKYWKLLRNSNKQLEKRAVSG
ncbi:MAG: hypothetical protein M0R17_01605 [Candidatus Omnitrophica bacterium]|nr:hypothetical protein [Candidatus Omnitrophota bacterium]